MNFLSTDCLSYMLYDKHFLKIQSEIRRKTYAKPYLTKGISQSITRKPSLSNGISQSKLAKTNHAYLPNTSNQNNDVKYIQYTIKLNHVIRLAKKQHKC